MVMEEIARIIESHREALNRVMKVKTDIKTSTVTFGAGLWLKKPVIIVLWILAGVASLFAITGLFADFTDTDVNLLALEAFIVSVAVLALFFIRVLSYKKTVNLDKGTFEFAGRLRKNTTYSLTDYEGAETRCTIKGFPEEFWVSFKTDKGSKRHKLADLNLGFARNIEPNHEAVVALWETVIQQIQTIQQFNNQTIKQPRSCARHGLRVL